MTQALTPDLPIQIVTILLAVAYGAYMTWRVHDRRALQFSTSVLQAMTLEAALIVVASLLYPPLFKSLENQRAFMAIIAMMTVIYATRDILSGFGRSQPDSSKAQGRD